MTRNLKALGLSLVVVFALSAMAASSASAVDHFTTEGESAILTGVSHNHEFKITGSTTGVVSTFNCTTSKFTATVVNTGIVATVDPEYTGTINQKEGPHTDCSASAGNVTIDTNGCHYLLSGETTGKDGEETDATVSIECPKVNNVTQAIKITSSLGITITVPEQTPTKGGVAYVNKEEVVEGFNKKVVEVKATATGITYTCAGAFLCGLGGIATHCNDSNYTGTVVVTGYKDESATVPLTPIKEGKTVNVEVS